MSLKKEISALVNQCINNKIPIIELRGADELARINGDLDFMVPEGQALRVCKLVAEEALSHGFYLIGFRNIGYLAQIVLVKPNSTGSDEAIKIDFFDGMRWYGVGKDLLGKNIFSIYEKDSNKNKKYIGAVSFLQKILTVGHISHRDWARYASTGADIDFVFDFANQIGISSLGKNIKNNGVTLLTKWRLRAASGGVTNYKSFIFWAFKIVFQHLSFKWNPGSASGSLIGLSGLDGSGKSTLVNRLESAYQSSGFTSPQMVHLIPSWIPMPHQVFLRKETKKNYTRPYSEPPVKSNISGGLRLCYYLIAFLITKIWCYVLLIRGQDIIFDRSLFDFMADPTRSKIPSYKVPISLIKFLMPAGDMFFLNANPNIVVSRKGELSYEKASALRDSYIKIGKEINAIILDGNQSADSVYSEFLKNISNRNLYLINAAYLNLIRK